MTLTGFRMSTAAVFAILALSGCAEEKELQKKVDPAHVSHDRGSDRGKVTLTADAARRIDLGTARVRMQRMQRSGTPRLTVPYSSLIYAPDGRTWVYTSSAPLTFQREEVDVDYIEGDAVVLRSGPAVETEVASVGVAEIYGTEFEVGH